MQGCLKRLVEYNFCLKYTGQGLPPLLLGGITYGQSTDNKRRRAHSDVTVSQDPR